MTKKKTYSFLIKSLLLIWTTIHVLAHDGSSYYYPYYDFVTSQTSICQLADTESFYGPEGGSIFLFEGGELGINAFPFFHFNSGLSLLYSARANTILKSLSNLDIPIFTRTINYNMLRLSRDDEGLGQIV